MRFWCAALGVLCCVGAGAVESFDGPDLFADSDVPVVLTPARLRQPQSQVPASVTIIDRELIEATGAREIYQLLQLVPGMSAVKVDGNVPTVAYHGTQSRDVRRMLVMIDGRSQYLSGLGRVLWNDFPLHVDDIERIEVTRGPASAAYGANAFQGVINIVTRHPHDVMGTTVSTRQGNNGVSDVRITAASRSETVASRVTVSSQQDDGYTKPYLGVASRDSKTVHSVNLRTMVEPSAKDTIEFFLGGSQRSLDLPIDRSDFADFTQFINLPENRAEEAFAQVRWQRQVAPQYQFRVQAYSQYKRTEDDFSGCFFAPGLEAIPESGALLFSREMRDLFESLGRDKDLMDDALVRIATGTPDLGNPAELDAAMRAQYLLANGTGPLCGRLNPWIVERRQDLEIENVWQLNSRSRLVLGANLRLDEGESPSFVGDPVRNVSKRLFGNLELNPVDPLFFNLGGYWEKDELNGSYFNPRAGLIWQFHPSQSVRLIYSEAVRTMDLYEMKADIHLRLRNQNGVYAADPVTTLGWMQPEMFATQRSDGNLQAEKIRSREFGYYGRAGAFEWDWRLFRESLHDLVSGPINPLRFRPDNDAAVHIQGSEVQVGWRPSARHLLRLTAADIDTEASHPAPSSVHIEEALAADVLLGGLWRFDVSERWMLSTNWYYADDWQDGRRSKHVYQRGDLQVRYRVPGRHGVFEVSALVQHLFRDDPVVRRNNFYSEDSLYWLSAAVSF